MLDEEAEARRCARDGWRGCVRPERIMEAEVRARTGAGQGLLVRRWQRCSATDTATETGTPRAGRIAPEIPSSGSGALPRASWSDAGTAEKALVR